MKQLIAVKFLSQAALLQSFRKLIWSYHWYKIKSVEFKTHCQACTTEKVSLVHACPHTTFFVLSQNIYVHVSILIHTCLTCKNTANVCIFKNVVFPYWHEISFENKYIQKIYTYQKNACIHIFSSFHFQCPV